MLEDWESIYGTPEPTPAPTDVTASVDVAKSVDALFNSIGSAIALIVLGYLARWTDTVNGSTESGLGQYVAKIALPITLFSALASLSFASIQWSLVLALFVAKIIVSLIAGLSAIAMKRDGRQIARAGIYSIFVSQSNDLPIGLPIVNLLFPEFRNYLYIAAVVQLCIINPVGYFCMECNPKKSGGSSDSTNGKSDNRGSNQNLESLGEDIEEMRNCRRQNGEDKYVTFDLRFKYKQEDEANDPRLPLLQRVDENAQEFGNTNNYRSANGGLQRQGIFHCDSYQSSNPLRSMESFPPAPAPPPPPTNGLGRWRNKLRRARARVPLGVRIIFKTISFTNPVVPMTFLGLIYSLIFQPDPKLPGFIDMITSMISSSFPPCALILLGMSLSGRGGRFDVKKLLVPVFLAALKLLALPLAARYATILFGRERYYNRSNTTLGEAANFAFFYGTIPTAPSVYVFAKQYNIGAEQISAAIVVAQVASAPLMILTNLLIVQTTSNQKSFHRIISKRLPSLKQWFHGLGLISCVFLIIVFWSMKELRRCSPLYENLFHLAISQILFTVAFWACQGWVPFQNLPSSTGTLRYVFENVFRIVARLYCAKNSLILAFGHKALSKRTQTEIHIGIWAFSIFLTIPFVIFFEKVPATVEDMPCVWQYGSIQYITSTIIDILLVSLHVYAIVLSSRKRHHHHVSSSQAASAQPSRSPSTNNFAEMTRADESKCNAPSRNDILEANANAFRKPQIVDLSKKMPNGAEERSLEKNLDAVKTLRAEKFLEDSSKLAFLSKDGNSNGNGNGGINGNANANSNSNSNANVNVNANGGINDGYDDDDDDDDDDDGNDYDNGGIDDDNNDDTNDKTVSGLVKQDAGKKDESLIISLLDIPRQVSPGTDNEEILRALAARNQVQTQKNSLLQSSTDQIDQLQNESCELKEDLDTSPSLDLGLETLDGLETLEPNRIDGIEEGQMDDNAKNFQCRDQDSTMSIYSSSSSFYSPSSSEDENAMSRQLSRPLMRGKHDWSQGSLLDAFSGYRDSFNCSGPMQSLKTSASNLSTLARGDPFARLSVRRRAQILSMCEILQLLLQIGLEISALREPQPEGSLYAVLAVAIILNDGRGVVLLLTFGLQSAIFREIRQFFSRLFRKYVPNRLRRQITWGPVYKSSFRLSRR